LKAIKIGMNLWENMILQLLEAESLGLELP
jgi:hypothetical protein